MREITRTKRSRYTKSLGTAAGVLVGACLAALATQAGATNLAWDQGLTPGGSPTAPTGSGGTGTWNNGTTANWSNSTPTDQAWVDNTGHTATDVAIFGGSNGTVTLGNATMHTLGVAFQTSGYTIGASGATNVITIGDTMVTSQPTFDLSAISGGTETFNAPVDISGVNGNVALDPLLTLGNNTVNFNGFRNEGSSALTLTANGTGTLILNNSPTGAYGGTPVAPVAWALSNSTSPRTWIITAGTTAGVNMTVNGKIANDTLASSSTDHNNAVTFSTGGTLTLTDSTSDATLSAGIKGWNILNGSTLSIGVGDGTSAATGVLGNRANMLILGSSSTAATTGATVALTAPFTLSNPMSVAGSSTVPITFLSSNNGTVNFNGAVSNFISNDVVTVNDAPTFTGSVNFGGTISMSTTGSSKGISFAGNGPVTVSGTVVDGSTSTGGHIGYSGTGTLTIASSAALNENGTTAVSSGTMLVNGNSNSTTNVYTISGTGTLGGTGKIAAVVNLIAGSNTPTLAPGPGPSVSLFGDLTVASLVEGGNTTNNFQIDHTLASNANDELTATTTAGAGATGAVTLGGTLNVTDVGNLATTPSTTVFDLFSFVSESGTFSHINLPTPPSGYTWHDYGSGVDFDYTTGDISLDAVAVPEPASLSLLALSGVALLRRRSRRD